MKSIGQLEISCYDRSWRNDKKKGFNSMKQHKLLKSLSILAFSTLLLAACGDKKDTDTHTSTSESETTKTSDTETAAPKKSKEELDQLSLPQLSTDVAENEDLVELVTNVGNIKIKLFPELAPKAVENFMKHAKDGYYNGVIFHRVINEFMVQSGDPDGTGMGGESIWGEEFAPELSDQLYHIRGALAMARTNAPVTAKSQGSQFYIVQNDQDQTDNIKNSNGQPSLTEDDYPTPILDAYKKGGTPFLDGQYSVFGQVIEGMDVVDKIADSETDSNDKPKEEVKIEKIDILQEAK